MKRFLTFMVAVLLILTLTGCQLFNSTNVTDASSDDTQRALKLGNTFGNYNNNKGIAAFDGKWIYYATPSGLYKMKPDGTGNMQLYEGKINRINVANEWVYFYDLEVDDFYRIKTDGTGLEVYLSNASQMYYANGYIYYIESETGFLHRMLPDKSEDTTLIDQTRYVLSIVISDDKIYWRNPGELNISNLDGTDRNKVKGVFASRMLIHNGYKYTENPLTKSDVFGNNSTKLIEGAKNINISGDWIYYLQLNDNNSIYKVRTDGSEITKINDSYTDIFCVAGGWIFYCVTKDSNGDIYWPTRYYKMRTNGSDNQEIF